MSIENLLISSNEKLALSALQKSLIADYGVEEIVAFGSGVKSVPIDGTYPDLLALTDKPVVSQQKQAMMELVASINRTYNTNFNILVFDRDTWEVWAGQTLYMEVKREGIQIW